MARTRLSERHQENLKLKLFKLKQEVGILLNLSNIPFDFNAIKLALNNKRVWLENLLITKILENPPS